MISAPQLAAILHLPPPTDEQVAVIEAPLEPVLVVAGAGSGKTETMAARVLFLVANGLVRPDEVLGLTFTRKAASGLATRIRKRLRTLAAAHHPDADPSVLTGATAAVSGLAGGGEPEVSTYHSFGGRLISEFGPLAGIEPASSVLSPTGSWQLARRVVARWDGDLETDLGPDQVTERLLAMAGGLADHLIDPQTLAAEINSVLALLRAAPPSPAQRGAVHSGLAGYLKRLQDRAWILPLVDAFTEAKRGAGVVDFADQMHVAANLVASHPRIGEALRERHKVVLLDEYQDTGHAQRVILRGVFAESGADRRPTGHPVTAVGDPVQTIYSWRGASASNLPRFPVDFPARGGEPAATLALSTSFRNASAILNIANDVSAVIRQGPAQVQELRPRVGAGEGEVRYGLFETVQDEEKWVADEIAERWRRAGWDPSFPAVEPLEPTGGSRNVDRPMATAAPPTTAVLMRRRRDMEPMAMALRAVGLPVEVVGLGGLLSEPEIADLVALLRVLVDPAAGPAALRLLTGARWQLGMADIAALSQRAAALTPRPARSRPGRATDAARGLAAVQDALDAAGPGEEIDSASLIDAISDPGPAEAYSAEGFRRLRRLGAELHRLRSRLTVPLPDLIADLERASGLDVEVRISSPAGRVHLDAFADVVAEFAAGGGGPLDLIDYLLAAAEREDGLAPGEVVSVAGRVQVLTVHAAKGLEWEVVAVPQLSDTVFPGSRSSTWLGDAAQLPPGIRGDAADLPQLCLPPAGDQKDMVSALSAHTDELKAIQSVEERRLLYVAITRAELTLLASGHQWGRTGSKPHGPSEFLEEIAQAAGTLVEPAHWAPAPGDDEGNPLAATPRTAIWPQDPLGARRRHVQRGADLVRRAIADRVDLDTDPAPSLAGAGADTTAPGGPSGVDESTWIKDPNGWARDVEALLAERRSFRSRTIEVELPPTISATSLVELTADAEALARRIRRPVPHAPSPEARRGTAFHGWLERFFTASALMEIADLPGGHDELPESDPVLDRLKAKFEASSWAVRVPFEVELPFSMTIAEQPVRGRVDAVFRDDDGGCTVVDWKTGHPPTGDRSFAASVQLAVYRLAVSQVLALPLASVRAAFVYVAVDQSLSPTDLLDETSLGDLIRAAITPTTTIGGAQTPDRGDDGPGQTWHDDEPPDPEDPEPTEVDFSDDEMSVDAQVEHLWSNRDQIDQYSADRKPGDWATVG